MPRFALVKNGTIINFVEAEVGWKHPDGNLVPAFELTEASAEKQGINFARSGGDLKGAYTTKKSIVLGGVTEHEVYRLLNTGFPDGYFIAGSSGTTGGRKLACVPWSHIDRRAAAFLDMLGSDFESPVWFPNHFSVTAFSSTGRMACLLNEIPCYFGPDVPDVTPKIVAGTPQILYQLVVNKKVPEDIILISSGGPVSSLMLSVFLPASKIFIDYMASSDGGAVFMNKYRGSSKNFETVFPSKWGPVIGVDGIIEVSLEQAATHYIGQDLPIRNGRFLTGDKVEKLGEGRIQFVGRSSDLR